jgi:hypothetical protein
MGFAPQLKEISQSRGMLDAFLGYNHNLRISDTEFYDEQNMTADYYPVLSPRRKRGIGDALTAPQGMIEKDSLCYVDDGTLYMNELATGLTGLSEGEKTLVSFGAYILVFPDKKWFNTAYSDDDSTLQYGSIEQDNSFTVDYDNDLQSVTFTPCKIDGVALDIDSISDTEPSTPTNGYMWLDTSDDTHILKQYSETSAMWTQVPTVYCKISYPGIGTGISKYDGVTLTGFNDDTGENAQIEALNNTSIVFACDTNYIVVVGLIDSVAELKSGDISVKRSMPTFDYICESNNRLWACYYGMKDDKAANEIYACKLGDFKNWNCFMGISTDSYAVSLGTDGVFTGAITYGGMPTFFKENSITQIYGTLPSNYQTVVTNCRGVQRESHKSLQIVNEVLYFKSCTDVCVFDGSLPVTISAALGEERYTAAVAGAIDGKYYISMKDSSNVWVLFCYDTKKGIWHKEDNAHPMSFCKVDTDLYYIDSATKKLNTIVGTTEDDFEWFCESGDIGYGYPDQKYLSRFVIRVSMGVGSKMDVYTQYDSSGDWQHITSLSANNIRSFSIPIVPRRCDHMKIKFAGVGECKIYSIAKILEQGSDAV